MTTNQVNQYPPHCQGEMEEMEAYKKELQKEMGNMDMFKFRKLRSNVRNFLYPATIEEMEKELQISLERRDFLRAYFIEEMIREGD